MPTNRQIPLFPLHTVLFPGGRLPLRIFEPRYTDMISDCMKNNREFGVCLIREGGEINDAARTYEMGTLARIDDWHMRHDGLLGLTVLGTQRFNIRDEEVRSDKLVVADVEILEQEPELEIPNDQMSLVDLCRELLEPVANRYEDLQTKIENASWVGFRLAELLPLKLTQKQYFLQIQNPLERLQRMNELLETLNAKV
jgi:Lon protease-like protein